MGVLAIWRYPVKAMLGELLSACPVVPSGLLGDRAWVVVDEIDDTVIGNKRGPTHPLLRSCRAELLSDGSLRVTLPSGESVEGPAIDDALSSLLRRAVHLKSFAASADGVGRFGEPAAFHDFAPVHVMTTSTLARMRSVAPGSDWDARRFRANVLLDDGPAPLADGTFAEDALLGHHLANDAVGLAVGFPTPRCVVPTRATEDLPHDPRILRTIVAEHRAEIPGVGSYGCLGAYAEVTTPGTLTTGDHLTIH